MAPRRPTWDDAAGSSPTAQGEEPAAGPPGAGPAAVGTVVRMVGRPAAGAQPSSPARRVVTAAASRAPNSSSAAWKWARLRSTTS